MNKGLPFALLATLACGCSARRTAPGPHKDGYGVETQAATKDLARRDAVAELFSLYLSSPAAATAVLDNEVLARAGRFILREKARESGGGVVLRAVVDYRKLAKELDKLGLVRPEGVRGKPPLLISLKETGPGTGRDLGDASAGRASDAMRRRFDERGYSSVDNSDALMGGRLRTGSREEALASGRKARAEVVVAGEAAAEPVADARLAGYGNCRVVLKAQAVSTDGLKLHASVEQETTSVDTTVAAACVKALENAGEIAADRLGEALAGIFRERSQFTVIFNGLGGLDRANALLAVVRGLSRVAGAHFDAANGGDIRTKIYTEKMGADQLAADLLELKEFRLQVRQVDPDYGIIEFGNGDGF